MRAQMIIMEANGLGSQVLVWEEPSMERMEGASCDLLMVWSTSSSLGNEAGWVGHGTRDGIFIMEKESNLKESGRTTLGRGLL